MLGSFPGQPSLPPAFQAKTIHSPEGADIFVRSGGLAVVLIVVLLLAASLAGAKDNGASIYKSKCAGCHGAQGEGKSGPRLAGTSLSEDDIVNVLMNGGQPKAPHTKKFAGATDAKAKAVAAYVKSLK